MCFQKPAGSVRFITRLLMVLFISFAIALTGCSSDDSDDDGGDVVLITYSGKTAPVEITAGNAEPMALAAVPSGLSTLTSNLTADMGPGDEARQSMQVVSDPHSRLDLLSLFNNDETIIRTAAELDSYSESCTDGGTFVLTLTNIGDNQATGKMNYNNCIEGAETTAGESSFVLNYDSPVDFKNSDFSSISTTHNIVTLIQVNDAEGLYTWFRNYTFTEEADGNNWLQTVSGRLYISTAGYVEVETDTALVISSGDAHPTDGVLTVSGVLPTGCRLTVSADGYEIGVELDGEPEGDPDFDDIATITGTWTSD